MTIQKTDSLGSIVAKHPATSIVFTQYNIDFCCQGKKTLEEAAQEKKIDLESVLKELIGKAQEKTDERDWTQVDDIEAIIDHINEAYHEPIKEMLPELDRLSEKVARVHGDHHPELLEIREIVEGLIPVIDMHFQKEEMILQPMMKELNKMTRGEDPEFHCGSIQNPIRQMEYEHENYGAFLFKLRELTEGYTIPEGACMSYTTLYELLKKIDDDLQKHTHLENFVLHPLAIKKETGETVKPSCCGHCH